MAKQKVDNNLLPPYEVEYLPASDGSRRQVMALNNGFAPPQYDEIVLGYSGGNLTTATYKLASVVVGTLTLTYSGSNVVGVVRT